MAGRTRRVPGKGKRRQTVDSISTEDDTPSRRAEAWGTVTKPCDRRHEGVMMARLETAFLDTGALHRSPSRKTPPRAGGLPGGRSFGATTQAAGRKRAIAPAPHLTPRAAAWSPSPA